MNTRIASALNHELRRQYPFGAVSPTTND